MSKLSEELMKTLRPPMQDIAKVKDPTSFIDLLAANAFIVARVGGEWAKIPVDETRTVFGYWLKAHDQLTRQKTIEEVRKKLPSSQNGTSPVFTADLQGSATGSGYNKALTEVNQVLDGLSQDE